MSESNYDVVVIGAGPGGYVAAIRASQLGMSVALIEREHLGGVCLNWGCIPTKALLKSAEVFSLVKESGRYGVNVSQATCDMSAMVKRSRDIVASLNQGIEMLLKKHKVEVLLGSGKVLSPGIVAVTLADKKVRHLKAKNIILATGASARTVKGFDFDGNDVWSYKDAMMAESVPKSLIIVGGGAIGIEFAYMYNSLGSKVTILESSTRILFKEDLEISDFMHNTLKKSGIEILTEVNLESLDKSSGEIKVLFNTKGKKHCIAGSKILMAVGVVPNSANLGLENTKVVLNNGVVQTDGFSRTKENGIFAIGDLTQGAWVAHKASMQAIVCVNTIAGLKTTPIDCDSIPLCIYSNPQVASIGLSEQLAIERGYEIRVGRCPFKASGKALTSGHFEGFIKSIFDKKSGELLGVHMVGEGVSELIHSPALAKQLECTEVELLNTIFPHPTLSEVLQESIANAFGVSIHI
jgi:dihydrolipoamide dehydrogenase